MARVKRKSEEVSRAEQVLDANRKLLGDSHPDTLSALVVLARSCRDAGNPKRARRLLRLALAEYWRLDGDESHSVLQVESLLAGVLLDLGDHDGARRLEEHALEVCERNYGPNDEATMVAMHNLSSTLFALGEYEASIRLEERILACEEPLPAQPVPAGMQAMSRIARARRALGEFQAAKKLDEIVVQTAFQLGDATLVVHARRGLFEDLVGLEDWDAAFRQFKLIYEDGLRELPENDEFYRELKKQQRKLARKLGLG